MFLNYAALGSLGRVTRYGPQPRTGAAGASTARSLRLAELEELDEELPGRCHRSSQLRASEALVLTSAGLCLVSLGIVLAERYLQRFPYINTYLCMHACMYVSMYVCI